MVDVVAILHRFKVCLIAVLSGSCPLLCCLERASADPAPAAVEVTRMVVPALALGLSHPRVVAAAAPQSTAASASPVDDRFADVGKRVVDLYQNGVDLSSESAQERLHVLVRSSRGGGAICLRYKY